MMIKPQTSKAQEQNGEDAVCRLTPQQLSFTGELFVEETGITKDEHIRILQEQALEDNKERNRLRQIIRHQKRAYRELKEFVIRVELANQNVTSLKEFITEARALLFAVQRIEEQANKLYKK